MTNAIDVTVGLAGDAVLNTVTVVICGKDDDAVDRTVTVGAAAVTVATVGEL